MILVFPMFLKFKTEDITVARIIIFFYKSVYFDFYRISKTANITLYITLNLSLEELFNVFSPFYPGI